MSWLEQLEQELDERLSAFLRSNPVQERLFDEQHQLDRARALERQREQLIQDANEQRRQLLALAADVKGWRERSNRARAAGADDLADRAEVHLKTLMAQGRDLWGDLGALGRRFQEVDQQLTELHQQPKQTNNLDKDWALFEAEQELNELRRQAGLN